MFRRAAELQRCLRAGLASYIDEPHLARLAETATPLSYQHRERLWAFGDSGRLAYILQGAFDIVKENELVDTLGPRQFLGLSSIWGGLHSGDVLARKTERDRVPEILLWDMDKPEIRELFCSAGLLQLLLRDAQSLIHHLNELQILYRRKRGAVAHVACHLRRLARYQEDGGEVEIEQKELGLLSGFDQRTVRIALRELARTECIKRRRRSVYWVNIEALTQFIDLEKRAGDGQLRVDN